jgi:hypothetical protein
MKVKNGLFVCLFVCLFDCLFVWDLNGHSHPPQCSFQLQFHFAGRLINSNEVRVCVCLQQDKTHVQAFPVIKSYP